MRIVNSLSIISFKSKQSRNNASEPSSSGKESVESLNEKISGINQQIQSIESQIAKKKLELEEVEQDTSSKINDLKTQYEAKKLKLDTDSSKLTLEIAKKSEKSTKIKDAKTAIDQELKENPDPEKTEKRKILAAEMVETNAETQERVAELNAKKAEQKQNLDDFIDAKNELNMASKPSIMRIKSNIEQSEIRLGVLNKQKNSIERSIQSSSTPEKVKKSPSPDKLSQQLSNLQKTMKTLSSDITAKKLELERPYQEINQKISTLKDNFAGQTSSYDAEIKKKKRELSELNQEKLLNKQMIKQYRESQNKEEEALATEVLREKDSVIRTKKENLLKLEEQKKLENRQLQLALKPLEEAKRKISSDFKSEHSKLREEIRVSDFEFVKMQKQMESLERLISNLSPQDSPIKNRYENKEKSRQERAEKKKEQIKAELQRLNEKRKLKPEKSTEPIVRKSKNNQDETINSYVTVPIEAEPKKQIAFDVKSINASVNQTMKKEHEAKMTRLLNLGINPYLRSRSDMNSKLMDDYKEKNAEYLRSLPRQKYLPIPDLAKYRKKNELGEKTSAYIIPEVIADRTRSTYVPKAFEISNKKLTLDGYQKQAIDSFKAGKTVIVTAPTGTGKTLIAEYGIEDVLKSGKRIIYLAPLKALSNEKFNKFSELFGDYSQLGKLVGRENVGIVTGDVKINENAPVLVMTTECYRNMVTSGTEEEISEKLKDVKGVIFDEFHYMDDPDRGTVWEESIMFSPPNVQFMMLSATASNANQIKDWLGSINPEKTVELVNVPEAERHVPLKYYTYASKVKDKKPVLMNLMDIKIDVSKLDNPDMSSRVKESLDAIARKYRPKLSDESSVSKVFYKEGIDVLKTEFLDVIDNYSRIDSQKLIEKLLDKGFKKEKAEQIALTLSDNSTRRLSLDIDGYKVPKKTPLISLLRDLKSQDKLPALFFIFSKKKCKKSMIRASNSMGRVTTLEERAKILGRIEECQEQGIFLGKDFDEIYKPALLNGFAVHHAGMLPSYKSLVEELFRDKLLKVCFATETLVAGINMPVKTVVLTSMTKMTSSGIKQITPSLLKQGSGRAGRRGIDDIGYVVMLPEQSGDISQSFNLLTNKSNEINSHLNLSYNFLLSPRAFNDPASAFEKSFTYYQTGDYKKLMEQSVQMKKIMKDRGLITQLKGSNECVITPKGEIASKVRGINEILLAEIISDPNLVKEVLPSELAGRISSEILNDNTISKDISPSEFAESISSKILDDPTITRGVSPSELAGIISVFVDNPARNSLVPEYPEKLQDLQVKVKQAIHIAGDIKARQLLYGINNGTININAKLAPMVKEWAEYPDAMNFDNICWKEVIQKLSADKIMSQEGDFLKVVNSTIDILKQIAEISPDVKLARTAQDAITMLKKPPVTDILRHELGDDAAEEAINGTVKEVIEEAVLV